MVRKFVMEPGDATRYEIIMERIEGTNRFAVGLLNISGGCHEFTESGQIDPGYVDEKLKCGSYTAKVVCLAMAANPEMNKTTNADLGRPEVGENIRQAVLNFYGRR